ncbi:hypothetical protein L6654_41310 [Bradyrhizobium sp. WYCCWR 13023]|uniref:Uncharacterized protein n=1 Tax=Bradyrhizobium zhengyangense TaxID=2911009 RepID=A0A9X1RJT3_9BRAD|nr:hypothetical protein [Bradyrhizobium zhengyangense]MCG2633005.1 hypothetical protein [Bradyrhizobium zhengyangense]
MAEGAWVVLGTAIGATGSLFTTWLTAYLKRTEDDFYDANAMRLLKKQLELKNWTDIETFEKLIGLNADFTQQYLVMLDARGSRKPKSTKWGLISKNPLSEEDTE